MKGGINILGEKGSPVIERERELQGLMNDSDSDVKEQAKKDWIQFLEDHPDRQTAPFYVNGVKIGR